MQAEVNGQIIQLSEAGWLENLDEWSEELAAEIAINEKIVDGLVFQLHFPDHMKERKIDVLQFVEKDIEEVMNPSAFGISPCKGRKFCLIFLLNFYSPTLMLRRTRSLTVLLIRTSFPPDNYRDRLSPCD